MPGTPATTPRLGIPRFANTDAVDFAGQTNSMSDAIDAVAARTDDARFTNQRVPTDGSVTNAKMALNAVSTGTIVDRTVTSPKIALGHIVDEHINPSANIVEAKLALATDAAAGTGSRRTLGTGATQAAAGNDSRIVNAVQPATAPSLAALTLTNTDPLITFAARGWNWYITGNDIALIDSPQGGYVSGYLAGHYSAWSDVSIKENITKLADPVDKLMGVEGKRHEWKDDKEHEPTFGFLAQDVEAVMPEVVGYDDKQQLATLDYMKMLPVVWEALKESIGVIRDLRDRVTALETAAAETA